MRQNVPALAVLLLLCAPGHVWSEEPHPTNVLQVGSSYQDSATRIMQDRNTRPSVTNLVPIYSVSNRQNAHRSAPETFQDFQSNYGGEPHQIPTYVIRSPQITRLNTILPYGSSPPETDESNPPSMHSATRFGSANQMISSIASAGQSDPSDPSIMVRGDRSNKIPIYVIRPPYPGMASPTLVNMAMLAQEEINQDIIKILKSLGFSQDRVPLVLVTGSIPSLTADEQNNAESGINTMDIGYPEEHYNPMLSIISPNTLSDEEWYDEEAMKHETLIHGRRPSSSSNLRRGSNIPPQLYTKSGVPPPGYWLLDPTSRQNIGPMNNEHFAVPRGRNIPFEFLPSQKNIIPGVKEPSDYYPQTNQVPTGLDSLQNEPILQFNILEHPIADGQDRYASDNLKKSFPDRHSQQPQFSRRFVPDLKQNPVYALKNDRKDRNLRPKYFPYRSSDVQEPLISPYPSQQPSYPGQYNNQDPYDFQAPSNPELPASDLMSPRIQDHPEAILQIGRFKIPETPSQYPSSYPGNTNSYPNTIPKHPHPDLPTEYPFIQKIPQDQLRDSSYPYSPGIQVSNTLEWPHHNQIISQQKYPQYHSHSQYPQYPSSGTEDIPQRILPEQYSQFPLSSHHAPPDYHNLLPHQIYPDQESMYPSGKQVPSSHPSSPYPSLHTISDDKKLNKQSRPNIQAQVESINLPEPDSNPNKRFPPYAPSPYPKDTFPQQDVPGQQSQYFYESTHPDTPSPNLIPQEKPQYPSADNDKPSSSINTLQLPSDQQPELSPDVPFPEYFKKGISPYTDDRKPTTSPRPEFISDIKKIDIPVTLHPIPQQKPWNYPLSSGTGGSTDYPERYPDSTPQYIEFPPGGQTTGYQNQPPNDDKPSMMPNADIIAVMKKPIVLEPVSGEPHKKYPQFPSADNDETINHPGPAPQQPYKGTYPDFSSDGLNSDYPTQPIDNTEPGMKPGINVISPIETFTLPDQVYPTPHQKYPHIHTSDTHEPSYYPDVPQQQYKDQHPVFPLDDQVASYPKHFIGDKEQGIRARPDIFSNLDKFSIPERPYQNPQQNYPHIPSTGNDEPIYYPDIGSQQLDKSQHPDFPSPGQFTGYPKHPADDAEPQMRPIPDVVSNMERMHITEQPYLKPQSHKYPQFPLSDTDELTYYSDSEPRQPNRATHPEFRSEDQVSDYPKRRLDEEGAQMRHTSDVVSNNEKLGVPAQTYPASQQKYSHIPSSGTDAPTNYPDIRQHQSGPGQLPDFPSLGHVTEYPKQPVGDTEPQMRPIPGVVSHLERLHIPEQTYLEPQQKYPQFPSSATDELIYDTDSDSRQPYKVTHPDFPTHGQISEYPKHPIDYSEPKIRPRPEIVSNIEKFIIPEQPFAMPQQKYPQFPSADNGEPKYFPGAGRQQPYKGQPFVFKPERYVTGYPMNTIDTKPGPDFVSNIEKFSIPNEPYPKLLQEYPRSPSSDITEPAYYPGGGPEQPYRGHHPDFQSHVQEIDYPKKPIVNTETKLRPTPDIVSSIDKFNIPEQPYPHPQPFRQFPSSDTEEPTNYPEIHLRKDAGKYPDIPVYGQIPATQKQSTDLPEHMLGPRPPIITELKKLNIPEEPNFMSNKKYPLHPSSDTDDTSKSITGPQPYTGEQPKPPSDGYPIYTTGYEEPFSRPRPETVSEVEKLYIPEEYHSKPKLGYPPYPSSDAVGQIYHSNNGKQQPYDQYPISDQRMSGYPKRLFDSAMRPQPEIFSVKKFNPLKEPYPMPDKEHSRHPSTDTNPPRFYPDEGPIPSRSAEKPWLPTDNYVPGQPHQHPSILHKDLPNHPKPHATAQVERLYIPEKPLVEQIEKYPQYVSVGTDDEHAGYVDIIPKRQYNNQQPQFPSGIPVPTRYQTSSYPYLDEEPAIMSSPNVQSQMGKFDVPTGESPHFPSSGSGQPNEPHHPSQQTPLPYDSVFLRGTPSPYNPMQPSAGGTEPSLGPDIFSQLGRVNVPEPNMSPQNRYPQSPSSFDQQTQSPSSFDQQTQSPYPKLVPSYQNQHYPQHPSANGEEPFRLLRPNISAEIGEIVIQEKTPMKPNLHRPVYSLNPFAQQQYIDQQPQWITDGVASTDYPDQFSPQYPSPDSETSPKSSKPGPEQHAFETPTSSDRVVDLQYPGMKEPSFDEQTPHLPPQFSNDISVPPDQPRQEFPKHTSFNDQRFSERPDMVSQIGLLKIPQETVDIRTQKIYQPVQQLGEYPQFPLGQQHPSSFESPIHQPGQHSLWQPQSNDMRAALLPRPDFTTQIERINIPDQEKSLGEQHPSKDTLEPQQGFSTSPLPDSQQPPSNAPKNAIDIPNQRPINYPSRDVYHRLPDSFPSLSDSTSSPLNPKMSDRDIVANVEGFKIPEGPRFSPLWEEYPQHSPKYGTLPQPETQFVPPSNLRQSNDIDINFERLGIPGQMSWQPGTRYAQSPSSHTRKPDEYPESLPQYLGQRPQTQMKPDGQWPAGGDRMPENANSYPSSSPYRPLQKPPVSYFPMEPPGEQYEEYPYRDIYEHSNQPRPRVTAEVEELVIPVQPHLLPLQKYPKYPSSDDEPPLGFPGYELQYPPGQQVPHDHKLPSSTYPLASQQLPIKQLQPDVQMRFGRLDVSDSSGTPQFDKPYQSMYTTTTTSKPHQQQWNVKPFDVFEPIKSQSIPGDQSLPFKSYDEPPHVPQLNQEYHPAIIPHHPSQYYPDYSQTKILNDNMIQQVQAGRQVQFPRKMSPDSTTIHPQSSLDVAGDKSFSDIEIEIPEGLPSVSKRYPSRLIKISPVVQLTSPISTKLQTYGSDQHPDVPHYPGKPSQPLSGPISGIPMSMWEESHPVDRYLSDSLKQPKTGHTIFHSADGEPSDQSNYPHGLPHGQPSGSLPVVEEPKHLKKPTVYVYPVPRRPPAPPSVESSGPQLERRPSGPPQSEPYDGYSPRTLDHQGPVHVQTPRYPALYPVGPSPNILHYDLPLSTPMEPGDFPLVLSRSLQGPAQPSGSTTFSPGTVRHYESDVQPPIEHNDVEKSSQPNINVRYTTSIYPEQLPTQSVVSSILPDGTVLYPQPSAEQITVSSTLNYPDEQPNQPITSTTQYLKPLEAINFIPSGPVIEGEPEQSIAKLGSGGGVPQIPQSLHDISHPELPSGQASSPGEFQPAEEPKKSTEHGDISSVNTLDFPSPTEVVSELKLVSVDSSTLPSADEKRGFYPDEALTTTTKTSAIGSARDALATIQSTQVPQVMPGKQLLGQPSNGVTDFTTQPSTLFEAGKFSVIPDSPQKSISPSLLPDSKITRIFPVTKPTFYTDHDGQRFVSLKLLNEPISASPTGDIIPRELTDSTQQHGTTDLIIPIGRDVSEMSAPSLPHNATQPHPMLKGIPIGNVQVFDAQTIIKVIESCNCSNLKFLIPILKRPQSAIVVANNEYPGIAN